MRTYSQYLSDEIKRLTAIIGAPPQKDELDGCSPQMWWKNEILPALERGELMPLSVCRSYAKHGGGLSLQQIKKFYPNSVQDYVNYHMLKHSGLQYYF